MRNRITFEFYNSFTNSGLGGFTLPFDRIKSTNGHYSTSWKKWKSFLANQFGLDPHWVRVKILFQ